VRQRIDDYTVVDTNGKKATGFVIVSRKKK
jgi:hypothetical protein